ncbi:hypothetical protein FG379_003592 [Cryptosporidium bovis]|uniref:uncharacterized protein n=1 Tax=Cryptosporidium bovis TaxID=310047 RepID=UPI003519F35C|nr:hypothetical protein FG379_003592 [Cryptosporidium bovis]
MRPKLISELLLLLSLLFNNDVRCKESLVDTELGLNNGAVTRKDYIASNSDVVIEFDANMRDFDVTVEENNELLEKTSIDLSSTLTGTPCINEGIQDIIIDGSEINDLNILDQSSFDVKKIGSDSSDNSKDDTIYSYVHGVRPVAPPPTTATPDPITPSESVPTPDPPTSPTTVAPITPTEETSTPEDGDNGNTDNEGGDDNKDNGNSEDGKPEIVEKPGDNESEGVLGESGSEESGCADNGDNNVDTNERQETSVKPESGETGSNINGEAGKSGSGTTENGGGQTGDTNQKNGSETDTDDNETEIGESSQGSESESGGTASGDVTTGETGSTGTTGTVVTTTPPVTTSTTTIHPGLIAGTVLGGIGGLAGLGVLAGLGAESRKRKRKKEVMGSTFGGVVKGRTGVSPALRGSIGSTTGVHEVNYGINAKYPFDMHQTSNFVPLVQTIGPEMSGSNGGIMLASSSTDSGEIT